MALRAGLLNEAINIVRAVVSKNDYGEEIETYQVVYSTRARITQTNSQKENENGEIVMNYTKEFFMRHYVPIREYDIITWNDSKYRVVSLDKNKTNIYIKVIGELINE